MATKLDAQSEVDFRRDYAHYANKFGLDPNPDAPEHHYDYRAAWKAGAAPDETGHWPSEFKDEEHPRRFLRLEGKIMDTRTMTEAPKTVQDLFNLLRGPRGPQE